MEAPKEETTEKADQNPTENKPENKPEQNIENTKNVQVQNKSICQNRIWKKQI